MALPCGIIVRDFSSFEKGVHIREPDERILDGVPMRWFPPLQQKSIENAMYKPHTSSLPSPLARDVCHYSTPPTFSAQLVTSYLTSLVLQITKPKLRNGAKGFASLQGKWLASSLFLLLSLFVTLSLALPLSPARRCGSRRLAQKRALIASDALANCEPCACMV